MLRGALAHEHGQSTCGTCSQRFVFRPLSSTAREDQFVPIGSGPLSRRPDPGRTVHRAGRRGPPRPRARRRCDQRRGRSAFLTERLGRPAAWAARPSLTACSPLSSSPTSSARRARAAGARRSRLAGSAASATTRSCGASWSASAAARWTPQATDSLAAFDGPARAIRCACAVIEGVREPRPRGPRRAPHRRVRGCPTASVAGIARSHGGARRRRRRAPVEVLVTSTVKGPRRRRPELRFDERGDAEPEGHPGRVAPLRRRSPGLASRPLAPTGFGVCRIA